MNITKFGLSNFRVFKEHFDFELAPIMVLTGPNNSGKSSLSKALLLLKENESQLNSDSIVFEKQINYFSGEHDLGNHKLVINDQDKDTIYSFTFFLDYKLLHGFGNEGQFQWDYLIANKNWGLVICQTDLAIEYSIPNIINYFNDRVKFGQFIHSSYLQSYKIDLQKISFLIDGLVKLPEESKNYLILEDDSEFEYDKNILQNLLISHFFKLTSIELLIEEMQFLIPISRPWFFSMSELYYINTVKEPIKRAYYSNEISVFQSLIKSSIKKARSDIFFKNDETDFRIRINIKTIEKVQHPKDITVKTTRELFETFIQKWLKEFEIGEELSFGYDDKNDFYFIKVDGKSLPEYGLGTSLIIHILLFLSNEIGKWRSREPGDHLKVCFPPTYIIEEPETGLHPAFQSKMAEMVVDIQKTFNVNLIIETHSEYFIRKLQYLTATNKVDSGNVVIYYFNNPKKVPENEEQIKRITILKDGSLSDNFGPGFIDEGINLKFELLRLNKSQIN